MSRPDWIEGVENDDALASCTRCGRSLREGDLVGASEAEEASAWEVLAQLQSSVSNRWEASPDEGAVGECRRCGSQKFAIEVERNVTLAAVYVFDGSWPERCERWMTRPVTRPSRAPSS